MLGVGSVTKPHKPHIRKKRDLLETDIANVLFKVSLFNVRYQINAQTELAVRYNDISPLENHHCAVAFQILAEPECNIFSNIDQEQFKRIRQVWVTILKHVSKFFSMYII